ncbi:MAG TPA: DNA polymerase III subunit delta [Gaiellaceae bacterium]
MAEELKPVYLIAGSDRPKVDRAVARLRGRFDDDAVELHDAGETSGDDAVAACNALGLFGSGARLVVVAGVEAWKADDAKAVAAYLGAPAPSTVLALLGGELKKDGPLGKAVAPHGDVLVWDVPQRGLDRWVGEQFKLRATPADAEACRLLVELVGDDLYDLAGEVDKLATWAGAEPVTTDVVEQLVAGRADLPAFVLTDAWGARDIGAVLRASERMLERTGDPRSRTIPRVVSALTNHVGRLRAVQRLDQEGVEAKEAASRLKLHPFYVRKLYGQSRNFSVEELRGTTVRLAELDHALKGGSRLANDLELERALVEITQP